MHKLSLIALSLLVSGCNGAFRSGFANGLANGNGYGYNSYQQQNPIWLLPNGQTGITNGNTTYFSNGTTCMQFSGVISCQ